MLPFFKRIVPLASLLFLILGCGGVSPSQHTDRRHSRAMETNNTHIANATRTSTQKRRGNWSLTSEKVRDVSRIVSEASRAYDLSEDLIYGIIWVESRFDPRAVSPVGAKGLMQLMPKTASYLADCIEWRHRADAFEPEFNIMAGTYYIARLIKSFNGDVDVALAAYNAGPTKVRRWLNGTGLPKVSVEYATMVQTARTFFAVSAKDTSPNIPSTPDSETIISDEALDRLGLAILIAGLDQYPVGLDREDDSSPFN